jgi:general L-amino acid transport system substrate-binding protein
MPSSFVLFLSVILLANVVPDAFAVSKPKPIPTLKKVRAAGSLSCGVDTEEPEWTLTDAHGNHSAFDNDICKAVAVAVLGANAKATIKYFRDEASSLAALKSGAIDVLATGSLNFRNDNGSFSFSRPIFYDFQGFLTDKSLGITSPRDFAGKKVCFLTGTEIEAQVNNYMEREKINFLRAPFSEEGEMEAALVTGNCAAITADVSQLAYERIAFRHLASKYVIMPDLIANDPLAPVVRAEDPQWRAIVDWTMQALIQAEELGIAQSNVKEMKKSEDIVVRRLLGAHRGWGQFLGLDDEWAARAIEAVGNYGEMFERDLGSGSSMRLDRGVNNLWNHGGLMFSDPIR